MKRYELSALGKSNSLAQGLITIPVFPWLPLILAALIWAYSLSWFDVRAMGDSGLISIFPISIMIAYLLILTGFAYLFVRLPTGDAPYIFHVLLLILMIHGTPQLVYGTLRYAWAWKHVGIVDYIIRHGSIDPHIAVLNVYHNWPGFFALSALFTQLAGFSGAQEYAGWAPVFFEFLFAFGILALFRLFTPDRRLQWLGVWFFILTNWVGQDYFSPQATTYFMMVGLWLLILRGFGPRRTLDVKSWKDRLAVIFRILRLPVHLVARISALNIPAFPSQSPLTGISQLVLGMIVLLVYGVIVSVHQLTPFMGLIAAIALVLFGVTRWRTLPLFMIILIVLWLAIPAQAYNSEVTGSTMESFGKIDQTVHSGLVDVTRISSGQVVVSWMGRGLSALIVLLAGFGVFQRIRKGFLDLPAILLAASPVIVLFLNSYGGEALFLVYFFMLPYLCFLAACTILPGDETGRGWLQSIAVGGLSVIMLVAFLFAYYGKERQYSFSKAEVEAAEYLYSHAVPNSLLVEGSRNYPTMFRNYEYFNYVPIDREPSFDRLLADPVAVLDEWLSDSTRYSESYLFITRSQKIYTDDVGIMPVGSLDFIQRRLEESGRFEIVFSNQDAIIFTIRKK